MKNKKEEINLKEKTIGSEFNPKNNIFSVMLFIASLIIIFYHAYPLYYGALGKADFITINYGYSLGAIVVGLFFISSGFLITHSLSHSKSDLKYLVKRILRIFPSLLFLLLIISFVIAPLLLNINYLEYLKNIELYKDFILNNLFLIRNGIGTIGTIFETNPYPSAIIGSLWTLKHTFFTYVFILILKRLGFFEKKEMLKNIYIFFLVFTLAYDYGIVTNLVTQIKYSYWYIGILGEFNNFIELVTYFLSGSLLYLYKDEIRSSKKLAIAAFITLIIGKYLFIPKTLCLLLLPYLVVYIGSLKINNNYNVLGNLSYSIFLYGFLVQQLIIYFYPFISFKKYVVASLGCCIILAIIIYFIVDKPVNKLTKKVVNRL